MVAILGHESITIEQCWDDDSTAGSSCSRTSASLLITSDAGCTCTVCVTSPAAEQRREPAAVVS